MVILGPTTVESLAKCAKVERSVACSQVLEQYMVPEIYAIVSGSPYGERELMQARA